MTGRHWDEFPRQLADAGMGVAVIMSEDSWATPGTYHLPVGGGSEAPLCGRILVRAYPGALRTIEVDVAECGYEACAGCVAASGGPTQLEVFS